MNLFGLTRGLTWQNLTDLFQFDFDGHETGLETRPSQVWSEQVQVEAEDNQNKPESGVKNFH